MKNEEYIDINKIAKIKGLKSNRSLRMAIQKGKYEAREVTVFGGKSYEILYSSLEPGIQEKLEDENMKCTALVPVNNKPQTPSFMSEKARMTALARADVVNQLQKVRTQYKTKKEADSVFQNYTIQDFYFHQFTNFQEAFQSELCIVGYGLMKKQTITEV